MIAIWNNTRGTKLRVIGEQLPAGSNHHRGRGWCILVLAALPLVTPGQVLAGAAAASSPYEKPFYTLGPEVSLANQDSLYFYAIEDLEQAVVVQRGRSTISAIAGESVILRPETRYRIWLLHDTGLQGHVDITTPTAGERFRPPLVSLGLALGFDSDGDGLDDDAEYILGTNPLLRDTDGDGVPDGAEHDRGTNPVDNRPVVTGIIASTDTQGDAVDVAAFNDIAAVADSATGVVIFNVQGQNPIRIAQVDTPGNAVAVSLSDNYVAVADGPGGLAIVDIANPTAASRRQIVKAALGAGNVQAVSAFGSLAFVGTDNGWISIVDLPTGFVLERRFVANRVEDLSVVGDVLYAYTSDGLKTFSFDAGIVQLGSAASPNPNGVNAVIGRGRMFVSSGLAYLVHERGVNVFSVTNPAAPVLLLQGNEVPDQFGWKQAVLNGSGLMLAAADDSSGAGGPQDVRAYNAANPTVFPVFLTAHVTPGVAKAVSIYNGLGYIADGQSGLHVLNYLAFDTGTTPPSINLSASFPLTTPTNGIAQERKLVRVTATVTDDVQVRNVEFYVDGVRQAIDGNFPFEHRFTTPARTATKTNFSVQARASDTAGNVAFSQVIDVALTMDSTAPAVVHTQPAANAIVGQTTALNATFNEAINESTLNSLTFLLRFGGPDGLLGTADDQPVTNGIISYRSEGNMAFMTFGTNLPGGLYEAAFYPPIADPAGNAMSQVFRWHFWILGGQDTDQDGIPDAIELAMGLDPNNPSSLNDGILDGNRDSDGDGLRNAFEVLHSLNPTLADSDSNGTPDGAEDPDHDGLTNLQEQSHGTHPTVADTDSDGWNDEAEVTAGSNPLDPLSVPPIILAAAPPVRVTAGGLGTPGGLLPNTIAAQPSVRVTVGGLGTPGALPPNTVAAMPPVKVTVGGLGNPNGLPPNTIATRPPIRVTVGGLGSPGGLPANTTAAQPRVSIQFQ